MKVLDHKLYYFLGIGGIGMSALARYFKHYGKDVAGYDKSPTELTSELESEGILCHYADDPTLVKKIFSKYDPSEILIVFTPAIPKDHKEYNYLLEQGHRLLKRSEVLGEITKQFRTIAIAGTHGKTTTTTMVSHLLKSAGLNCFAFMGGISRNYNTNLLLGEANSEAYVVVEADEYDRSFLTLHPYISVITSVDADHLDIYGDASHVKEGYALFAAQLKENGTLIVKKTVDNELTLGNKRLIYSLNLDTRYRAGLVNIENGTYKYDIESPVENIDGVELGVAGLHNVENSIAAVAVAQQLGVKAGVIREALRSFKGVKRRFDYRVKTIDQIYIDDYAHHPEELRATISSVKQLYPGKRVTGIFQPHLFSRTRDFADGFAESLDLLDECILLEIYPAREKPIAGVNSQMLLDRMRNKDKKIMSREQLLEELKKNPRQVLVTMGAGDIDKLVEPIERLLR
jgi:UDP-N-acetylmuramate--alanine ligase